MIIDNEATARRLIHIARAFIHSRDLVKGLHINSLTTLYFQLREALTDDPEVREAIRDIAYTILDEECTSDNRASADAAKTVKDQTC